MLQKLRKRLILFDTVITCSILSVVVFGACYINITQLRENTLKQFANLRDTIEYKLQTEDTVTHTWLSEMEASSQLIIHLEENASPFFFKGSWRPSTNRTDMIAKVKALARSEGIDTSALSVSFDKRRSTVFSLQGEHKDAALACVSIIPARNSFVSLTLIQFIPDLHTLIHRQLLLFTVIDILGCLLLLLVSFLFVNKALRPVEESRKKQNEFVAAASHDLRSPLAVIQTSATALLIEGSDPHRFVPKIVTECNRMSRLIGDMLILASSDSKSWILQQSQFDSESYLIDLFDTFASVCKKSRHQLSLALPEEPLPQLVADKDRLTQVLGILIDNAVFYSPEESTVILRPYKKKKTFILEVEDHGIGITGEQKPFVFDRFYRADHSRRDASHFGLGLSVAKELVELMGGKIQVKDSAGGGSIFCVELPLS